MVLDHEFGDHAEPRWQQPARDPNQPGKQTDQQNTTTQLRRVPTARCSLLGGLGSRRARAVGDLRRPQHEGDACEASPGREPGLTGWGRPIRTRDHGTVPQRPAEVALVRGQCIWRLALGPAIQPQHGLGSRRRGRGGPARERRQCLGDRWPCGANPWYLLGSAICIDVQDDRRLSGLADQTSRPSQSVTQATDDYLEAEDAIGQWIAECCDTAQFVWGSSSAIRILAAVGRSRRRVREFTKAVLPKPRSTPDSLQSVGQELG